MSCRGGLRVLTRETLRTFWERHADAEQPLRAWCAEVQKAQWKGPQDVKASYASASFLANDRVVFNIKGNTYRLVAHVRYAPVSFVFIRFIGTHAEYDKINAATV